MRSLVLAAMILVAGCVSAPAATTRSGTGPGDGVDPIIEQHDHQDPSLHAIWTSNMEMLGYSSLGDKPDEARGQYGEIDIQGDTAYAGVTGDGGEVPGFVIVNISQRAHPVVISFTPSKETRITDVKGDPTNHFLFVAAETGLFVPGPASTISTAQQLAAGGSPMDDATAAGIRIYDVSDPAKPKMVAFAPSDSGCHMVAYKKYAGGEWLFCVGTAVYIYQWDPASLTARPVSRYQAIDPPPAVQYWSQDPADARNRYWQATPHDMTLYDDPATGKVLMSVAHWAEGARLVDVTDPTKPTELSFWTGEGSKRYAGYVHSAELTTTPDGKRLMYVIPELYEGPYVAAVFVLDASDLSALKYLGEWAPAGEHPNDDLRFSTHNFQLVDGRMYLAFYHAGVWVLDITGPNATAPQTLGFYLPHESTKMVGQDPSGIPDTWDVVLKDGYLYALDIPTGLYVVHYKPDVLGDARLTSHT